mmetsp:Transcript_7267/g.20134  ORF Transcript_7267/g.20134 Transcript_7267/m.20134 type:complete len:263 (+) Transcript_7267:446-1234(+)
MPQVVLVQAWVYGAQQEPADSGVATMLGGRQLPALGAHAPIAAEVLGELRGDDLSPDAVTQVAVHVPQLLHAGHLEMVSDLFVGTISRPCPLAVAAPTSVGLIEELLHLLNEYGIRLCVPQHPPVGLEVYELCFGDVSLADEFSCPGSKPVKTPSTCPLLDGQLPKDVIGLLRRVEDCRQGNLLQRSLGVVPQLVPLDVLRSPEDLREQRHVTSAQAPLHLRNAALQCGLRDGLNASAHGGLVHHGKLCDVHPPLVRLTMPC